MDEKTKSTRSPTVLFAPVLMREKTKSTRSLTAPVAVPRPPQRSFGLSPFIKPLMVMTSPAMVPTSRTFSKATKALGLTSKIVSNIDLSKANLSAISAPLSPEFVYLVDGEDMFAGVASRIFFTAPPPSMTLPKTRKKSELTSKITVQCETGTDFGESKTDSIEAMLSHISAPPGLLSPRQLFAINNYAETLDLIWNPVSGFRDHAPYVDCFVKVEGSVEGRDRSIGGGLDGVAIWLKELTAPQTGRFGDPVELGSSQQVRVSVDHQGENSSGTVGSGAVNAGEERNGIGGGGRQGSGNEGRQGGLGAGGHGGDNGDDDGNNGRDRTIDVENERIPQRNPRQDELVGIYLPIVIGLIGIVFPLDDANLSALGSVLRCFALVCCLWSIVLFTVSLLERGRNERMARNLSIIGSILTALGFILVIAIKLPLNLLCIVCVAILVLAAIYLRSPWT